MRVVTASVTGVFYTLCLAGLIAASAVGIWESSHHDPVRVGPVRQGKAGLVVGGRADVTNHSGVEQCPDIRAVARDTNAKDLATVAALPLSGANRLAPHEVRRYGATIRTLSAKQMREKFKEVVIYVYATHQCPRR